MDLSPCTQSLSLSFSRGGFRPGERKTTTMVGDAESRCAHLLARVCTKACAESATTKNSLRAGQSDTGARRSIYRLCNSECIADVKPPAHVSHTPAHADRIVPCMRAVCAPHNGLTTPRVQLVSPGLSHSPERANPHRK